MPWLFKTSVDASGSAPNVSSAGIDTTGCDLFVAHVHYKFDGAVFSDSKGNIWTGLGGFTVGDSVSWQKMFYCFPTSVGPAHGFMSLGNDLIDFKVLCFSGAKAAGFDASAGGNTAGGSYPNNNVATGDLVEAFDNELVIIGSGSSEVPVAPGVSAPFILVPSVNSPKVTMGYLFETAKTTRNPIANATNYCGAIGATFQQASGVAAAAEFTQAIFIN
jgi:hypothetical protein